MTEIFIYSINTNGEPVGEIGYFANSPDLVSFIKEMSDVGDKNPYILDRFKFGVFLDKCARLIKGEENGGGRDLYHILAKFGCLYLHYHFMKSNDAVHIIIEEHEL